MTRLLFGKTTVNVGIILCSLIATLAVALGVAWAEQAAPPLNSPETALISGHEVTVTTADYQQALLALSPEQRHTVEDNAERSQELLFEIYTEKMLAREATQRGLDQRDDIKARLAEVPRKILANAIIEQERESTPSPDFTTLAEEYYLTHQQKYAQPERIQVAHILWSLKCDCENNADAKHIEAENVLKELQAGANFAEMARKYSDDKGSAKHGGDLGQWFTRGTFVKPFEDVAFALPEPGSLSDVVKTEYGYHIIKLLAHEPAGIQPFPQVKGSIIEELTKKYQASAHRAFVGQYYPTAEQFNRTAIDTLLKTHSTSEQQ